MWAVLLILAALAPPVRSFEEERTLLSRRLETLRRILPDGRHPTLDVAQVEQLAAEAGIPGLRVVARPGAPDSQDHVVLDVEGETTYGDVDRLFSKVALFHRPIDVAELTVAPGAADLVRVSAVLRVPHFPEHPSLPAPPAGTSDLVRGVPVAQAERFRRDEALALAKSDRIAQLRRSRRSPRLFLAETAAVVRDRPVILTHAHWEEEFVIRGLAVGEGPVRALETRFERGFFRVSEFLMAVNGACHRFEVRGRSPVVGPDADLPLPSDDPFRKEPRPCHVDRDPGSTRLLSAGRSRDAGPLNVRLREVDVADAFRVLHELTGQGFVVDGDVRGRVSLELVNVTLDEALRELRGAGLTISPPGLIRHVASSSRADSLDPQLAPDAGDDPRVTFSLKRSGVREVLALMAEIDPELTVLGPQASLGEVSVWVKQAPVRAVREAVLDSARLVETVGEERVVRRHSGAEEALFPVVMTGAAPSLVLGPRDLVVDEFALTGVATAGEEWLAFAYAATGVLQVYRRGDPLADATVASITSTDVVLDSAGNRFRLLVPSP
jgi:hypothetical protein